MTAPPKPREGSGRSVWALRLTLGLLFLFNANNALWLAADSHVLAWDENSHYKRSVKCGHFLLRSSRVHRTGPGTDGALETFARRAPAASHLVRAPVSGYAGAVLGVYGGPKHPPLVYLVAAPFHYLWGPDGGAAVTCLVFSTVLLLSVYSLGRRFSSPWGGCLAAFLAASTPLYYSTAQRFLLDAPLAAMVACAFAAYFASEGFGRRRASVCFGLVFGLGMLTKEIFPVFAGCLFVFGGARALAERRRGEGDARLRNAGAALLAAFAAAAFWYVPYAPGLVKVLAKHQHMGSVERDPSWRELPGLLYYVIGFVYQLSVVPAAAFAVSAAAFAWRLGRRRETWVLAAWVGVPLVFFTLLANKDFRYMLAALPAAAVVTASAVASLRPRVLAWACAAVLVAAGGVETAAWYWDAPRLPSPRLVDSGSWKAYGMADVRLFRPGRGVRSFEPSPAVRGLVADLAAEREKARRQGRDRLVVRYLHDLPALKTPVDHRFLRSNLSARYGGYGTELYMRITVYEPAQVDSADLVIHKEGGRLGPRHLQERLERAAAYFVSQRDRFEAVGAYRHDDGTRVVLYRRRGGGEGGEP